MINDYSDWGLKMIDIQSFDKSLEVTWMKKYLDLENKGKWKLIFDLESNLKSLATVYFSQAISTRKAQKHS